jgi:2-iminobutanoate/2-iminopropanoate deaminase
MKGPQVASILLSLLVGPAVAGDEKPRPAASKIQVVATSKAPKASGPYSQATRAGGFIFCAGQGAFGPGTDVLVAGGIKNQTRQVLRNLQAVLESGGQWVGSNEAYAEFFEPDHAPARSTVQGERWPEGHLVAMEAIALAE